jgi:hypothetical protein
MMAERLTAEDVYASYDQVASQQRRPFEPTIDLLTGCGYRVARAAVSLSIGPKATSSSTSCAPATSPSTRERHRDVGITGKN